MPCTDGGVPYDYPPRVDYEPLLCSACQALERSGYNFAENPLLDAWWFEHRRKDEERRTKEAYQAVVLKAALGKPVNELTIEEKRLLRARGFL
jgi:hypothetical protein